ncbi:uncharacterized protein LOC113272424 [Papaver somniferum]|uniref:uncharacterized protein LOC113272424 n=1 Tax=Papaver somniferum TaxID=3469 RepID=UPI000E701A52|nr:uncharacterized protein LOC113272424 [Papaver somniferum]
MQHSDNNPFDEEALHNLVTAQNEHATREVQANTLLRQKSRDKWVQEGATNTHYFHTKMKIRQATNLITEIEDAQGNIITDHALIADLLVHHFQQKFKFQEVHIADKLLDVIPSSVTTSDQALLDAVPSSAEIKSIIFAMDPESAAGPDSFSGIYYRTCWEIICNDLVIQFCWERKFIPKGLNSNFLVLLPKCQGAKKANQFRPIGLSNVLFKIFTKIITTRMNNLMVKLISPQQAAYIKGRSIHEQVLLASEMVNEMKRKRRGGNVAFKLDISQAYDSRFKAGDPLSPILFMLMEDVLSRNISHLVEQGKIFPMVVKTGVHPTHLFFADDVFIFCNGAKKSLNNLFTLLDEYQAISGVILAPGRVTSAMVWPVVEMIQHKLAKWKVYKWPSSVIKICEKLIRNFLWSGDSDVRKYKTFSWKKMKLHKLIKGNKWEIPIELESIFELNNMPGIGGGTDRMIWNGCSYGKFTTTMAMEKLRFKEQQQVWSSFLWKSFLHPSIACNVWKLLQGVYIDDDTVRNEESFTDVCNGASHHSPLVKEIWFTAACATMKELWFQKNSSLFDNGKVNIHKFKRRILQVVHEGGVRMKGKRWAYNYDSHIISFFNLRSRIACQ